MMTSILFAIGCTLLLFVVLAALAWFVIEPLYKEMHDQPNNSEREANEANERS
jgi:hypothetical protein